MPDISPQTTSPTPPEGGTQVFWQAHRGGGAREAPDNTMAAFHYAWDLDAIPEADVRTTKDGIPVCLHDPTLARTTTAPENVRHTHVAELTFATIKTWDAGSTFDPRFAGESVPALEDVFREMAGRKERLLYLDIKDVDPTTLQKLVLDYDIAGQVIFASPHPAECAAFGGLHPDLRAMLWIGGTAADIQRTFARAAEADFPGMDQVQLHLHEADPGSGNFPYHLDQAFLRRALDICRAADVDLEVFPFGFDEESLRLLLDLGIRWFATDEPQRFSHIVNRWQQDLPTAP